MNGNGNAIAGVDSDMKQSLRLGTISGIPVGFNWGLIVLAALYLVNLATSTLPHASPDSSTAAYWIAGSATVVVFFASILAHELGHSLVAQREGIKVRAITLWLLGGVAELESETETPGAEFRIAAAGPAVSLALAVVFFGAGVGIDTLFNPSLLGITLRWLGFINALLAVFNLIPAAPLDGGRILAAVLWQRSGDRHRARAAAARVGQGFGVAMLALGSWALFTSGTFYILILAWFLYAGATAERRRAELFGAASRASVGEVMAPLASPTDGAVTVSGLLAMSGGRTDGAFPVRGVDGVVTGIVPGSSLGQVPAKRRDSTRAVDLAIPWSKFVSARAAETLSVVVDRFRVSNEFHALVYDEAGNQTGYIGMKEISRAQNLSGA